MHLPDGIINNQIAAGFLAIAGGIVVLNFKKVYNIMIKKVIVQKTKLALVAGPDSETAAVQRSRLSESSKEKLKSLLIIGIIVFTIQLFDLPGFSINAHLIGGALAAFVLGTAAGILVMSAVLLSQALIGDGGMLVLGINIFNVGIVSVLSAYYLRKIIQKWPWPKPLIIMAATWLAVITAAISYSIFIKLFQNYFPAQFWLEVIKAHLIVGFIEALATVLIIKLFKFKIVE